MMEDRLNRMENKLDKIADDVSAIKQWKQDLGVFTTSVSAVVSSAVAVFLNFIHKS